MQSRPSAVTLKSSGLERAWRRDVFEEKLRTPIIRFG